VWKSINQSKVIKSGGRAGKFDQAFLFDLKGGEFGVTIEAYASRSLGDEFIGKAAVPMVQFFVKSIEPTWFRLGREAGNKFFAGEVLISSTWADDNKEEDKKEELIQQLSAQLLFYQQALAQKMVDANFETKMMEQKLAEANKRILDLTERLQKSTMVGREAVVAGATAAANAAASAAAAVEKRVEASVAPVVEELFENQRYMPMMGWKVPYLPNDRKGFSDKTGSNERTKNSVALPSGWQWTTDWNVDIVEKSTDSEGWTYATDFRVDDIWRAANHTTDTVRRRRWHRTRKVTLAAVAAAAAASSSSSSSAQDPNVKSTS